MVFVSNQQNDSSTSAVIGSGNLGTVELLGQNGVPVRAWRVRQSKCSIGSGVEANIRIESPDLAPLHLQLTFGRRNVLAKSSAVTFWVNGRSLKEWLFDSPCEINLGSLVLRVTPTSNASVFPAGRTASPNSSKPFTFESPIQPAAESVAERAVAESQKIEPIAQFLPPKPEPPQGSFIVAPNGAHAAGPNVPTPKSPSSTPGSQVSQAQSTFDPTLVILPQVEKLVQSFFEPLIGVVDQLRSSVEQVTEQAKEQAREQAKEQAQLRQLEATIESKSELQRVEADLSERIEQRLSGLIEEMDRLRQENSSLQRTVEEADRALEESLRQQIVDAQFKLDGFQAEMLQLRDERDIALAKLDQLNRALVTQQDLSDRTTSEERLQWETQRAEHESLLQQLSQLDFRLQEVQSSADQSAREWEQATNGLQEQLQYWQSHAASLEETINKQSEHLAQLEQLIRQQQEDSQASHQHYGRPEGNVRPYEQSYESTNDSYGEQPEESGSSSIASLFGIDSASDEYSLGQETNPEISPPEVSYREASQRDIPQRDTSLGASETPAEKTRADAARTEAQRLNDVLRGLTRASLAPDPDEIQEAENHSSFEPNTSYDGPRKSTSNLSFAEAERMDSERIPEKLEPFDGSDSEEDDHRLSMSLIASLEQRDSVSFQRPSEVVEETNDEDEYKSHPGSYGSSSYDSVDDYTGHASNAGTSFSGYSEESFDETNSDSSPFGDYAESGEAEQNDSEEDNQSQYSSSSYSTEQSQRKSDSDWRSQLQGEQAELSAYEEESEEHSFADRYADQEEDEDFESEYSPTSPERTTDTTASSNSSKPSQSGSHAGGDEEDSIEEYMQQLLQRVRGGSTGNTSTITSINKSPISEPIQSKKTSTENTDRKTQAPIETQPKSAPAVKQLTEPFDPGTYVPRQQAPERNRNMAAMRELANVTARTAIERSDRRRLGSETFFKVSVTLIGLIGGIALLIVNGFKMNMALVGSIAGFVIAGLWGMESISLAMNLLTLEPEEELPAEPESPPQE